MIQGVIAFKFPSDSPLSMSSEPVVFTDEEDLVMLKLPSRECRSPTLACAVRNTKLSNVDIATPAQTRQLYLTLVTILYSYAYDSRTTQNDPTLESAWTICALTPAFSALDPPPYPFPTDSTANDNEGGVISQATTSPPGKIVDEFSNVDLLNTLTPSIRRSLAFPLYRHFELSIQCIRDVAGALRRGKRAVLRGLLATKQVLDQHEVYYVYSKIWMDDLCSWVARYTEFAFLFVF